MKEYDVIVTLEVVHKVKAFNEDDAIQQVEDELTEDCTKIFDNLGYEVNKA